MLIGLGGIATAGGAVAGTGAFTSVEAQRSFSVSTAGDAGAYFAIEAANSPNGDKYVSKNGDTITVTLDKVNPKARTRFEDLLTVTNQGAQPVNFYVTDTGTNSDLATFEVNGASVEGSTDGTRLDSPQEMIPGESRTIDLVIDTTGKTSKDLSILSSVTFHATAADLPSGNAQVGPLLVDGTGSTATTFATIADALDAVRSGSAAADTIEVQDGLTGLGPVTVDVPDVTIRRDGSGSSRPEVKSSSASSTDPFTIIADDVTVDGFEVRNPGGSAGISLGQGVSRISVLNNRIAEVGADTGLSTNALGIAVGKGASDVIIEGNTIGGDPSTDFGITGGDFPKGIFAGTNPGGNTPRPISGLLVRNNSIKNVNIGSDTSREFPAVYGLQAQGNVSTIRFSGNTVNINADVDEPAEDPSFDKDDGKTDANEFAQGVSLGSKNGAPTDVDILDNELNVTSDTDSGGSDGSGNYEDDGEDTLPGFGVVVEGSTNVDSVRTTRINRNNLTGKGGVINQVDEAVDPSSGAEPVVLDATNNWWGDTSGPDTFNLGDIDGDGTSEGPVVDNDPVEDPDGAVADGSGAYVGDRASGTNDDDGVVQVDFSPFATSKFSI
ncbi:hypothetical protein [Haloglomus litoreum]|uniref:hypothetical protein n=1 Tax=Haloglomus litoreum TaxID=3034026 RepID=UPI0023E812A4|nr:hypothetical protein [Haloglomus sp. DT116]